MTISRPFCQTASRSVCFPGEFLGAFLQDSLSCAQLWKRWQSPSETLSPDCCDAMVADIKDLFAFSPGKPPRATKAPIMCAHDAALQPSHHPFYLFLFFCVFQVRWKHGSNGVSCLDVCLLFSLGALLIGNPLWRKFCLIAQAAVSKKKLHQIFSPRVVFLFFFFFCLWRFSSSKTKNRKKFCLGAPTIRRIHHPRSWRSRRAILGDLNLQSDLIHAIFMRSDFMLGRLCMRHGR